MRQTLLAHPAVLQARSCGLNEGRGVRANVWLVMREAGGGYTSVTSEGVTETIYLRNPRLRLRLSKLDYHVTNLINDASDAWVLR